jgi:hypothetical protein
MSGTLIWLDSFDFYTAAQGYRMYNGSGFNRGTPGRTGLYCGTDGAQLTLGAEIGTITMGAAWAPPGIVSDIFFQMGNTITGTYFSIGGVGDGRFWVHATYGGSTNTSAPSTFVFTSGQWYFIELQVNAVPTYVPPTMFTGGFIYVTFTYDFHVNENSIMSGMIVSPSFPTGSSDTSHHNFVDVLWGHGAWDDIYITDTEFLGDGSNVTLYPASDVLTGFTPSGGGNHWQMVNEHGSGGADDDTTYNDAPTAGLEDRYTLTTIPAFTGDIKGTMALWLVRKTDAGSAAYQGNYNGADPTAETFPNMTYKYLTDPQRKNPASGVDWTLSDINSLELGIVRVI